MAVVHRNEAQRIAWPSTSTGTGDTAFFEPGRQYAFAQYASTASTGTLEWKMQGSNSTSGKWFDLCAVTSSTGAGVKGSTVTGCFDRVRLVFSANNATAASTKRAFWISAR